MPRMLLFSSVNEQEHTFMKIYLYVSYVSSTLLVPSFLFVDVKILQKS
jgi:hypothetical protein